MIQFTMTKDYMEHINVCGIDADVLGRMMEDGVIDWDTYEKYLNVVEAELIIDDYSLLLHEEDGEDEEVVNSFLIHDVGLSPEEVAALITAELQKAVE